MLSMGKSLSPGIGSGTGSDSEPAEEFDEGSEEDELEESEFAGGSVEDDVLLA